jgi:hypothetical protein
VKREGRARGFACLVRYRFGRCHVAGDWQMRVGLARSGAPAHRIGPVSTAGKAARAMRGQLRAPEVRQAYASLSQ